MSMAPLRILSMSEPVLSRRKWMATGLFVSVALNCLLAGLIVGRDANLFGPEKPSAVQGFPANGFGEKVKSLPDDERRKYNLAMKPFRPALREARENLIAAREHMNQVINAEPYDLAAVKAALADVQQKTASYQQQVQDETAEALADLTPQSRHALIGGAAARP